MIHINKISLTDDEENNDEDSVKDSDEESDRDSDEESDEEVMDEKIYLSGGGKKLNYSLKFFD